MRLQIVLPLLAVGLVGCTSHVPGGTDPFFGRTTVAPPATGSVAASDPAYWSRGSAAASPNAPPPSLFSPSTMPTVAKAPAARTPRLTNGSQIGSAVPLSNSSVPLNIAPKAAAPINPVTVSSNTTYTPSGSPYAAGSSMGLSSVGRSPGAWSSSTASGPGPAGPGPKMTRTRVSPLSLSDDRNNSSSGNAPSSITPIGTTGAAPQAQPRVGLLADNRSRTFGQLGQVAIDGNGNATHTFSAPTSRAGAWTNPSRPTPGRPTSGPIAPRRIDPSAKVIDIMDLPPKSSRGSGWSSGPGSARASTTIHHDPAVRPASATMVEPPAAGQSQTQNPYPRRLPESNKPISFIPSAKYGHADNHSWLKGRLEYSQAKRRWKLRYIPIDGQADRFGGSVILQKTALLSGYERGDYVEIKGRLADDAKTADDYAPDYAVTQIKRATAR